MTHRFGCWFGAASRGPGLVEGLTRKELGGDAVLRSSFHGAVMALN